MAKLSKNDLHLMGSAGSIEALKIIIMQRLFWSCVDITDCKHTSRLGKCYGVSNAKGVIPGLVIIEGRRWGLYRINR